MIHTHSQEAPEIRKVTKVDSRTIMLSFIQHWTTLHSVSYSHSYRHTCIHFHSTNLYIQSIPYSIIFSHHQSTASTPTPRQLGSFSVGKFKPSLGEWFQFNAWMQGRLFLFFFVVVVIVFFVRLQGQGRHRGRRIQSTGIHRIGHG
jgi:hypothetical protein